MINRKHFQILKSSNFQIKQSAFRLLYLTTINITTTSAMDQFFHIRMLVSMIVSLSMAHLLKGVAKIIEHPKRKEIYWVHLLWVFYMFIQIIDFWWWEFRLKRV